MRKKIFMILTLFWMVVIFCFSAQTAEESTEVSNSVGMLMGHILIPGFDTWDEGKQLAYAEKIEYPVRKCAHASEYAILGFLLVGTLVDVRIEDKASSEKNIDDVDGNIESYKNTANRAKQWKHPRFIATAIGILYACSDEFHQIFVPGRSGQVTDVLIDSMGVIVGVLVGAWLLKLITRHFIGRKN